MAQVTKLSFSPQIYHQNVVFVEVGAHEIESCQTLQASLVNYASIQSQRGQVYQVKQQLF